MFITTILVLVALSHQTSGIEFKACKVKDDECLKGAIQDALEQLKSGDSKYNIPSIDPVAVPESTIGAGTGVVHLVQHYSDVTITGFSKMQVEKAHMDFDKMVLTFDAKVPQLEIKGNYNMEGKILVIPVKGKGTCSMISTNLQTHNRIQFEKKDEFYIPKSYDIRVIPGGIKFNYENLFDGNKLLGDNVNKVLNDEWEAVYKDVGRNYETSFARFCIRVTKAVFSNIPAKKLFLE